MPLSALAPLRMRADILAGGHVRGDPLRVRDRGPGGAAGAADLAGRRVGAPRKRGARLMMGGPAVSRPFPLLFTAHPLTTLPTSLLLSRCRQVFARTLSHAHTRTHRLEQQCSARQPQRRRTPAIQLLPLHTVTASHPFNARIQRSRAMRSGSRCPAASRSIPNPGSLRRGRLAVAGAAATDVSVVDAARRRFDGIPLPPTEKPTTLVTIKEGQPGRGAWGAPTPARALASV